MSNDNFIYSGLRGDDYIQQRRGSMGRAHKQEMHFPESTQGAAESPDANLDVRRTRTASHERQRQRSDRGGLHHGNRHRVRRGRLLRSGIRPRGVRDVRKQLGDRVVGGTDQRKEVGQLGSQFGKADQEAVPPRQQHGAQEARLISRARHLLRRHVCLVRNC